MNLPLNRCMDFPGKASVIALTRELFANLGDGTEWDRTVGPSRDPYMSPWLARRRRTRRWAYAERLKR